MILIHPNQVVVFWIPKGEPGGPMIGVKDFDIGGFAPMRTKTFGACESGWMELPVEECLQVIADSVEDIKEDGIEFMDICHAFNCIIGFEDFVINENKTTSKCTTQQHRKTG